MNDVIERATRVLRDVFGYSAFRGEQADIVADAQQFQAEIVYGGGKRLHVQHGLHLRGPVGGGGNCWATGGGGYCCGVGAGRSEGAGG